MRYIKFYTLFIFVLIVSVATAQSNLCTDEVERTIASVVNNCNALGRNQVCYGNHKIDSQTTTDSEAFSEISDIIQIDDLVSLQTYPFSDETTEWGIAVFRLRAMLEGTIPGQVVTVIVFGDAEIMPDTESVDQTSGMMQAFYLRTGIGASSCEDLPDGGVLLQNPQGETVNLVINGVALEVGSTVLLTADDTNTLDIVTLDGNITASVDETQQDIPAGFQLSVTADEPLTTPEIAPDIEVLPLELLPELLPQIGEPAGAMIGILQCAFSGGADVATGADIYLRGGWADTDLANVINFAVTTPPTVTFDDMPISYSYRTNPYPWLGEAGNGFQIHWFWEITDISSGMHQVTWVIGGETVICEIRAN